MAVVASLLSVVVSSTTLLVVPLQRLLYCSNQSDLKLWLMLILSRHGEPFFLSLSRRYGFVVVQIAVVVADHPRAATQYEQRANLRVEAAAAVDEWRDSIHLCTGFKCKIVSN